MSDSWCVVLIGQTDWLHRITAPSQIPSRPSGCFGELPGAIDRRGLIIERRGFFVTDENVPTVTRRVGLHVDLADEVNDHITGFVRTRVLSHGRDSDSAPPLPPNQIGVSGQQHRLDGRRRKGSGSGIGLPTRDLVEDPLMRFLYDNLFGAPTTVLTPSSEVSALPAEAAQNPDRSILFSVSATLTVWPAIHLLRRCLCGVDHGRSETGWLRIGARSTGVEPAA